MLGMNFYTSDLWVIVYKESVKPYHNLIFASKFECEQYHKEEQRTIKLENRGAGGKVLEIKTLEEAMKLFISNTVVKVAA